MRLGLMLGYGAKKIDLPLDLIKAADELGVYAVWTSEAYGSDAVTPLAWIGAQTKNINLGTAIMQMPGRTPANTAMTAMTLNQLSGGRFLLGLGMSGPQVVEGWHGVSYHKPLTQTREYIQILRQIFRRVERLEFSGEAYQIPYQGSDSTGLGKPLKSTLDPAPDMPIYLAAMGPKNVQLAAEIADGWLPIFFSPSKYAEIYKPQIDRGLNKAGKTIDEFDIAPLVPVVMNENLEVACNQLRPMLAIYIGGMGAKGKNFYHDLACRFGYQDAADEIQDLYLSGEKGKAMMAVPEALIDEIALVGSRDRIKDRLSNWIDSPVMTLNLTVNDVDTLRMIVELLDEI